MEYDDYYLDRRGATRFGAGAPTSWRAEDGIKEADRHALEPGEDEGMRLSR